MKKAVVLLSGGMDSAVALYWAKSKGHACFALSFNYGQRHLKELRSAKKIAKASSVPLEVVEFKLPWSGSTLTDSTKSLPHHTLSEIAHHAIPSTYVPGRNSIFLSFAMSYADQIGAENIVIGANALDYSGYPDCRPAYLKAFERVATEGSRAGTEGKRSMNVLAPLIRMSKSQIIKLGFKLRVPLQLTWSCYQGGRNPCGKCDSCLLREKGFVEAGLRARPQRGHRPSIQIRKGGHGGPPLQ